MVQLLRNILWAVNQSIPRVLLDHKRLLYHLLVMASDLPLPSDSNTSCRSIHGKDLSIHYSVLKLLDASISNTRRNRDSQSISLYGLIHLMTSKRADMKPGEVTSFLPPSRHVYHACFFASPIVNEWDELLSLEHLAITVLMRLVSDASGRVQRRPGVH
jgi:hypothetical protein